MPSPLALNLPVALIRVWLARPHGASAGRHAERAIAIAGELAGLPGFARISDQLFAALPLAGQVSVFDLAVRWSTELVSRLARDGVTETPEIVIFPGQIVQRGGELTPADDFLLQDFERQQPGALPGGISLTGYAARWLRDRYRLESAGFYCGPSGRRIPLYQPAAAESGTRPWHNPEILGRQLAIARPAATASLEEGWAPGERAAPGLRVRGAFGVGKSHAVWHFLEGRPEPKVWIGVGRALPGTAILADRLAAEIERWTPGAGTMSADGLAGDPERAAAVLAGGLDAVRERVGAPLWVVCDVFQTITRGDLDLVASLLRQPRIVDSCRLVLISRTGLPDPPEVSGLPVVEIPILAGAELEAYRKQLFAGLGMSDEMIAHWVDESAGNPFLLEEGLVGLVHAGRIRRVYGSFFFAGGDDISYQPSQRLVRHVESEGRRLGEPLPLRILAASGETVPAFHLELAAAEFGIELPAGWQLPFLDAGWLREAESSWGPGLELASPIYQRALNEILAGDSEDVLRHALGQVMAAERRTPTGAWHAYRLLAGSPEALTPLLDFSHSGRQHPSRGELFEALREELRLHRERRGDETTELDLLWSLLPLGHRLGKLRELGEELGRALELSADRPNRHVALLALHAELELEKGRFEKAESSLRKALKASENVDESRRAAIFVRLGDLLVRDGRLREAREIFEGLLEIVKDPDAAMAATCHYHLGNVALRQKELDEALAHHEEACRIRQGRRAGKVLGMSLSALGSVHLARGDFAAALRFYREAAEVLEKHPAGTELALVQRGAGRALSLLGDHLEASKLLRRALAANAGRDIVGEALARLEIAANQLALGNVEQALEEARQSHFQLSLSSEAAFLGDAEQVLGEILKHQHQPDEAREHLEEARRLHLKHGDRQAAAVDVSLLLGLATERRDARVVEAKSAELEDLLEGEPHPAFGEVLYYRLYKACDWLRRNEMPARAPENYLRRAFQELLRKTSFLTPELRHVFLYQNREHRELVNEASSRNLTFPGL